MFYIGTNLQLLDKCCKRKVKINFSLYKICLKHIKKRKTFGVTGGFRHNYLNG